MMFSFLNTTIHTHILHSVVALLCIMILYYAVPSEYKHWLDATMYEIVIPSRLEANTPIKNITLILADSIQSDDEDDNFSGSGTGSGSGYIDDITFHLDTTHPFFYFQNADTTHVAFPNGVNDLSSTSTCTLAIATSRPIPLGDYEMQVRVTGEGNELQRSDILIHVVDELPSTLPPPGQ